MPVNRGSLCIKSPRCWQNVNITGVVEKIFLKDPTI